MHRHQEWKQEKSWPSKLGRQIHLIQVGAVRSSSLVLNPVSDFLLLCSSLLISFVNILDPGLGRGESAIVTNVSFTEPSTDGSEIDTRSRFSCDRWQIIRPLFHPGKEKDGEMLSLRNEYTAFATGNSFTMSFVMEVLSIYPRLTSGKST